jgi:prepilin-type N-terminal cleavage/methylation domain-containing protein
MSGDSANMKRPPASINPPRNSSWATGCAWRLVVQVLCCGSERSAHGKKSLSSHRGSHLQAPSAFSLMELLVVIAVFAVLVVTVMPSVGGVLDRAKQTAGLSNMRQIGSGFMAYAADSGGKFPHSYDSSTGRTYAHFLNEYLPQNLQEARRNLFVSPAAEKEIASGAHTVAITYSAHPTICHEKAAGPDQRIPLSSISRPSRVILLADAPQVPWNNNQSTASFWNPWPDQASNPNELIPTGPDTDTDDAQGWFRYRNGETMQALMADGSVQKFKKGSVTYANILY